MPVLVECWWISFKILRMAVGILLLIGSSIAAGIFGIILLVRLTIGAENFKEKFERFDMTSSTLPAIAQAFMISIVVLFASILLLCGNLKVGKTRLFKFYFKFYLLLFFHHLSFLINIFSSALGASKYK